MVLQALHCIRLGFPYATIPIFLIIGLAPSDGSGIAFLKGLGKGSLIGRAAFAAAGNGRPTAALGVAANI